MSKRTIVLFAALLFAFGVSLAFAQETQEEHGMKTYHHEKHMRKEGKQHKPMSPEQMMKKRAEKQKAHLDELTQKLSLAADQQARVKEILERTHNEARAILEEARNRAKDIKVKAHEEIKSILTEEQKSKFQEIRHKHENPPKVEE